jgi:RHS repeat-associated protein
LEFNSLDQLTKVVKGTKSGQTWTWTKVGEYWYDANGMMAKSLQGGVETHYVYRGHDPLYEKTGTTSTFYFYANGRMVAKQVGSSDIYYYIADALGSTRQVWKHGATSPTFSVTTYKPFGTPVSPSGTEKFQYAGEMIVSVAGTSPGLYYIGARWMDPELGRWLSLDPELGSLSMPQTMNRYVYCVNNPLRFVDPTGEWLWVAIAAGIGAVVGVLVYAIITPQSEWTWEEAFAAALGGAAAGAVTALTFNPAWGAATWTAIAGGAVAGAAGGAAGGAVEYVAEGGFKAVSGKPYDWSIEEYYKQMGLGAAFGAVGGAAGGLVGRAGGKLFIKLTGEKFDDIIKGLSSKPAILGATIASQFPEEMVSQIAEWLARKISGQDVIDRYVATGVFREDSFISGQIRTAFTAVMPTYVD